MAKNSFNVGLGFGTSEGEAPEVPNSPVISATSAANKIILTVDGDAGVTNIERHKLALSNVWVESGSRSGDGIIEISDLISGVYHVIAYSSISGVYSKPSELLSVSVFDVAEVDPFSKVHSALWDLLEADSNFTSLVKIGNRIKFSGQNRSPEKVETITADFPEVRIVAISSLPHPNRSSNMSSVVKQFAIQVLSGDKRLDALHFQLEWIVYRILSKAHAFLTSLTWNSKPFVLKSTPVNVRDSMAYDSTLQPGVQGWISLWSIDIEMFFQTSDL